MRKRWIASGLIVGLLCVPFATQAVIPVFDEVASLNFVADFMYTIADYAQQVKQLAEEVKQYEQMVIMVEDWALALKQLDFSALPIIGEAVGGAIEVFQSAKDAFFNAATIAAKFHELYKGDFTFSWGSRLIGDTFYFEKAFDWNEAMREANEIAMYQQAQVPAALEITAAALEQGLHHSEAAVGPLQAQQATNQLIGTQIQQANTTNALLATMAHAQSTRDMFEASARQEGMLRQNAALVGWGEMSPDVRGLESLPTSLK